MQTIPSPPPPAHPAPLHGRIAIVTGASGDIGQAIIRRLHQAGATVAGLDLRPAPAAPASAAATLPIASAATPAIVPIRCDIADPEAVASAVDRVVSTWGGIHILVNNAAAPTTPARVEDITLADWQRTLDVNLTAAFLLARAVLPRMRAAGRGVILNIASQLGHVTNPRAAAYSTSKGALLALTRSIAVDYAGDGIRAVSLSPGAVMTSRLTDRYGSEAAVRDQLAARHPVGRLGTPDEIAAAALFLVSDEASFVTAADLLVDGGYTAV